MVNYSNGKIYKIEPITGEDGDVYIGSTTKQYLSQRMDTHRRQYNHWLNNNGNKTSSFDLFEKYGLQNCQIILLEAVDVNSKDELIARERYYIQSLPCVNKNIPGRTTEEYQKQYRENNKERLNQHDRERYIIRKDEVSLYCKQYYEANKEAITERNKTYMEAHKEQIKEYQKRYREENREKIAKQHRDYKLNNREKVLQNKRKYYLKKKELIAHTLSEG